MTKFIIKRLLALIPVLIGVTLLVFCILDLAPGDPAKTILGEEASVEAIEALREEMGLDDPLLVRYGRYMAGLVQGDLGTSYKTGDPVSEEVWARLPNTIVLALTSTVVAIILALPLGVLAAIKQNTLFDGISMFISLIGISMPVFWMGLLLILLFAVTLGWFPVSGADQGIRSLVLPSIALGFMHMASIARTTRSSMLETIRQDYIRTVRAKGLPEREVITDHALKNALIPTITVIGIQIGQMLGGSVLTESVFAWPGIGRYMIQSIQGRDIPSVMGCIIIFAIGFALVNLLVDLIYGFVDPRIKAQYK
ncbi:MAG: ABC transporter permease [Clostridiales bacterium]|nr:ABC transporter permease [Clostridiales bacterium]